MSTLKKSLVFLLIVVLAAFCISGCGSRENSEESPVNVVIVGGMRANQPSITASKLEEVVEKAAGSNGNVTVISVEGEPRAIATVDIPDIPGNIDPGKRESMISNYTSQILSLVSQSKAATEEADCLSAIQMASRQLASYEGNNKYLLILDNGVSTKGSLDMTQLPLANLDVEETVRGLKESEDIPPLNGVLVYWAGLGECAGVQKDLMTKQYNRLTELWTAILEESGASVNMLTDISTGEQAADDLPPVKPVAVAEPVSVLAEGEHSVEEIEKTIKEREIIIDDEIASFLPDSAILKSGKKKLKSALEPIAKYLQHDKGNQIVLIGTTASAGNTSGDDSRSIRLSGKRAETIKKIILLFDGISPDQIKTVGLGYQRAVNLEFAIKDVDSQGRFMERKGAHNRQVIITSSDSDRGRKALAL